MGALIEKEDNKMFNLFRNNNCYKHLLYFILHTPAAKAACVSQQKAAPEITFKC